eukprot:6762502-Ditylum_brightwellii.AAC.1
MENEAEHDSESEVDNSSEHEMASSPIEQDEEEDLEIEADNISESNEIMSPPAEQGDAEVTNDTSEEDTGVVDEDKCTEVAGVIENVEGPKQNNSTEITGLSDSESTGVPNATINNDPQIDNGESDGQDNSPIKQLRRVFQQADNTLQGELRPIKKATKQQGRRTKPTRK